MTEIQSMRLASHLSDYTARADSWLAARGYTRADIKTGRDAWAVAHGADITRHAYSLSRDIVDAHIQTALERIFPHAVFSDAKRY
jgi:hypothetical protein